MEGNKVAVSRIEPVSSSDPFTEAEWTKIRKMASKPPAIISEGSKASLQYLKKHLKAK